MGSKFFLFFFLTLFTMDVFAGVLTCRNITGGTWNFGTVPNACSVEPLQSSNFIFNQYSNLIYNETHSSARLDYMQHLHPVLRDAGTYYIKRRNPQVSPHEIQGFLTGLFALAHQESFWSHYRRGRDGVLRYMRGDNTHGHGLMQIDDRGHAVALVQGKGVDLIHNIIYGLDIFYKYWVRSAHVSCVSSRSDYISRSRSAWAAYNGGSNSICRWTNRYSPYANNDLLFWNRLKNPLWRSYISNPSAKSSIDVVCMAEGIRPCRLP